MKAMINPVPKPRQTRSDKWKKRPSVVSYRAYADKLRHEAKKQKFSCPEIVTMKFYIEMPKSWTKKKRSQMDGQWHQQKPDIDNLVKSVLDALLPEDSHVYHITALKKWSNVGSVEIY